MEEEEELKAKQIPLETSWPLTAKLFFDIYNQANWIIIIFFRIRPHNLSTKSWKFWQQCLLSWFSMKMPCHCGKSFEYKIDLLSWGAIKRATTGLPFLYCGSVAYGKEGGKSKNLGEHNKVYSDNHVLQWWIEFALTWVGCLLTD